MITTDDIMALVRCRDPGHLQRRLEEAVADLAAERDAKAEQIRRLIRELDIACALSLKAEDERDALLEWKAAANGAGIQQEQALMCVEAERDLAIHEQDTAQESLRRHQMWLQEAQAERDALRQDVQRLSEALRQEIDPPTFMGEPVSLLRKPVKSIADIKECYCPQDKCQAPVIMGRQTPCIRKMKEQK